MRHGGGPLPRPGPHREAAPAPAPGQLPEPGLQAAGGAASAGAHSAQPGERCGAKQRDYFEQRERNWSPALAHQAAQRGYRVGVAVGGRSAEPAHQLAAPAARAHSAEDVVDGVRVVVVELHAQSESGAR